tara:strand:- start:75 stop:809 length:735 start_codon:yes stop_codon:yes gene_type:complete
MLSKKEFEFWATNFQWNQRLSQNEIIKKLQKKIVQGLFPQKDFPLLNESYDAGLGEYFSQGIWDNENVFAKKQILREKLMINFDKSEYKLKYENHIVKIIDILDDLSLPLHITHFSHEQQRREGIFKQGKLYLELGKFAGTYYRENSPKLLQFELLFITQETWDEEAQQSEMRHSGVSFNPNKMVQEPQFSSRFPWDYYFGSGLQPNATALIYFRELTYEVYVELIRQLNAPFNVSLNYPGGLL